MKSQQQQPLSEKAAMAAQSNEKSIPQPPPSYQTPYQNPIYPEQSIGIPPYLITRDCSIFGKYSVNCICPNCKKNVFTLVSYENSVLIWIMFIVLLIVCFLVCWVPFVIDGLKDIVHTCPNCKAEIYRSRATTRL